MAAWVICGALSFGWMHSKNKAMHRARLKQAEDHHKEQLDAIKQLPKS